MTKRLQVLVDEAEWREIRQAAKQNRLAVAEWVRQAMRAARRLQASGDAGAKLDLLRAAARHEFPTADIGQMLSEIESGYGPGGSE